MVITACLIPIFTQETGLFETDEEGWVYDGHIVLKKALQQIQAPATALVPTALATFKSSIRSSLARRKHATPPCRLIILCKQFTIDAGDRPTHRAGSKVEADVIVAFDVP